MSQDSLDEGIVDSALPDGADREARAKRKRELFDSIENDIKRLPPSKRKRSHILPKSPTDSDERNRIKITESTNTTELQPATSVPSETIESSSTEKNEKSEEKIQPRRSSRKKNTIKLNKVSVAYSQISKSRKQIQPIENDRLTPMGLPKPIRLGKNVEVSLEDIYMQKDYRTPKTTSALPTIIDENDPKVKKSVMTKLKRCRHIDFQTDPALRKVKKFKNAMRF